MSTGFFKKGKGKHGGVNPPVAAKDIYLINTIKATNEIANKGADGVNKYISAKDIVQKGVDQILSGSGITWIEGWKYSNSSYSFIIRGIEYTNAITEYTLDPSHLTLDRYDIAVLTYDVNGEGIVKIKKGDLQVEGFAAIVPTATPGVEIYLATFPVKAGLSAPDTITNMVIYSEDASVVDANGLTVIGNSTVSPYSGAICIKATDFRSEFSFDPQTGLATAIVQKFYIKQVTPFNPALLETFKLQIISDSGRWDNNGTIKLAFIKADNSIVGDYVIIDSRIANAAGNPFAFESRNFVWQTLTIPTLAFNANAADIVGIVVMKDDGRGTDTFRLDLISVQGGIVGNTNSVLITSTAQLLNQGADKTSKYVELDELADVAISGNYNDLYDRFTIIPYDYGERPTVGLTNAIYYDTSYENYYAYVNGAWEIFDMSEVFLDYTQSNRTAVGNYKTGVANDYSDIETIMNGLSGQNVMIFFKTISGLGGFAVTASSGIDLTNMTVGAGSYNKNRHGMVWAYASTLTEEAPTVSGHRIWTSSSYISNVANFYNNIGLDFKLYPISVSPIDISGKEDITNKQNSLATDGTGAKYPTVDAVNAGLATKLDASAYNQHFKGIYLSLAALNIAHPTASVGDYAQVNEVGATDVLNYNWDAEENIWVANAVAGSGATNTDELPEGTSNLYFNGARVLATVLTGISFLTGSAVVATDNILVAFGKLQKQISDLYISQVSITTAISITSETLSDAGYSQNGKNVLVKNSANAINITVGATENFTASYQKEGTATITFLASSGKTIRQVDATAAMSGAIGSTATVSVVGTIISLRISNA